MPAAESPSRFIDAPPLHNLRDVGGYATRDDRTVRWRRLIRGSGLHRATGVEVPGLDALRIRTFVDLRTEPERTAHGTYAVAEGDGRVGLHLPVLLHLDQPVPDDDPEAGLLRHYGKMIEQGAPAVVELLERLGDPDSYPVAIFCTAGKDRTGVATALVLSVLGVPDETIAADYALSEGPVADLARGAGRTEFMAGATRGGLKAPPTAMARFLAGLRETAGPVEDWARANGGHADVGDRVRAQLLEP
jgi:protein-tyrosine phosphatase